MTFEGLASDAEGGAVRISGGRLYVFGGVFQSNEASGNGGAVAISGGEAVFEQCTFLRNSASCGSALQCRASCRSWGKD